jgi:hypothetical protein
VRHIRGQGRHIQRHGRYLRSFFGLLLAEKAGATRKAVGQLKA